MLNSDRVSGNYSTISINWRDGTGSFPAWSGVSKHDRGTWEIEINSNSRAVTDGNRTVTLEELVAHEVGHAYHPREPGQVFGNPALEKQIRTKVNEIRAEIGLPPIRPDDFIHFVEILHYNTFANPTGWNGHISHYDDAKCFLAGTPIDMWPVEAVGFVPNADGNFDQEAVRAGIWQKPIEDVTAKDWVLSFDQDGNLKPGRVKRTFENEAKIILDFHGTFVTPAHVYYCAGGTYEGKYIPLIDILRDDGVVQHVDGSLIRASTGCEIGAEDDKPFWAFLLYEDENGLERVREKRQLRLGTRWMMANGKHFSMREYMEGCGIELVDSGELEGYVRFKKTGLTTVFAWTLSDTLPSPEDFVLRRSQTTLEDIYRASEWESVHPQMPAPVTMDSGPVQPLSVQQFDDMPRNNPIGFQNNSPSSEFKLNRKARKAEAARQRKIKKVRQKADSAVGTLH